MTAGPAQTTTAAGVDPRWPAVTLSRGGAEVRLYGLDSEEYVFRRIRDAGNFYESVLLDAVAAAVDPDSVVVDVGANLGNHTVFFAGLLGARVVAVEPEARNAQLLQANVLANGLGERVQVHRVAVGDHDGPARMVQRVAGNSGTWQVREGDGPDAVRRVRLDDLTAGLTGVALVKVDVEGDEAAVLRGGMDLLERERPVLCVETHEALDYREVAGLLEPLGYVLADVEGLSDNSIFVPTAADGRESGQDAFAASLQVRAARQRHREMVSLLRGMDPRLGPDADDDVASELAGVRAALLEQTEQSAATRERLDALVADDAQSRAGQAGELARSLGSSLAAELGSELRTELRTELGSQLSSDLRSELSSAVSSTVAASVVEARRQDPTADELVSAAAAALEANLSAGQERLQRIEADLASLREGLGDVSAAQSAATTRLLPASREAREMRRRIAAMADELAAVVADRNAAQAAAAAAEREAETARRTSEHWRNGYLSVVRSRSLHVSHAARVGVSLLTGRPPKPSPVARVQRLEARARRIARSAEIGLETPPSTLRQGGRIVEGDVVRASVAAIASRREGLRRVVASLLPQVDEMYVWLNGFTDVPDFLRNESRLKVFWGDDLGDRGKFRFVDEFEGYYLTVDDDIDYPAFYVEHLLDGIERYGRQAAVGWHGSILKTPFSEYYDPASRQVLSFRTERGKDTQVHVLGTGCVGFHTDTLRLSYADFELPNMADVFFARAAQEQDVPLVVLNHRRDWATPIEDIPAVSISGASMKGGPAHLDVRSETNRLVSAQQPWRMPALDAPAPGRRLSVALVGRVDRERWKKGGILKSAHLTSDMLAPLGVDISLHDLERDDCRVLGGRDPSVVLVYPGDPDRPDFATVEQIVDHHLDAGRVVVINLSLNLRPARTDFIVKRMSSWAERHGQRVRLMAFADMVRDMPALNPIRHLVTVIPKTIAVPGGHRATFHETSGVFLGDYGKLCEPALMDHPVEEWVAAVRRCLPGVPLHAVQQYKPRQAKQLGVDVKPYLHSDYGSWLTGMRLMVSPFRFCTFEMVPIEVAGMGVPVVYRGMEQSLSEYLGMGGVEVESPQDLADVLPYLYRDTSLWRRQSEAGIARAESWSARRQAGQMYLRLRALDHLRVR